MNIDSTIIMALIRYQLKGLKHLIDEIMTCPKCGAEAWCNIDCDLCKVCIEIAAIDIPDVK